VHIVIDDPINDANGYAFPTRRPTVLCLPPDPLGIGDYAVWQDLLTTHEPAHVAHLTVPRNRSRSSCISSRYRLTDRHEGTALGDGSATYVEGRVSGTGRRITWRAAILRQFARGRLPAYGQLSSTGGWMTGEFAYLVGSPRAAGVARVTPA
jgi:hypothetical protein